MPSLTASFVDVLDQSVNFTHLVPCTMSSTSSSLLLPNLPRNWWQISSSLRARPQRLSSSVIFSVHMLTPSTSLILKHVVGSAFGAHGATTGNAVRAAARSAVCASLHCEAVQRTLFVLARGNPFRPSQYAQSQKISSSLYGMRARHDGAPVWPRVTLFLRSPR